MLQEEVETKLCCALPSLALVPLVAVPPAAGLPQLPAPPPTASHSNYNKHLSYIDLQNYKSSE